MTIPANLTHAEVGAFLQAVGLEMRERDLAFDAALDGCSDDILCNSIIGALYDPCTWDRAKEILALTGEEAINFVYGHTT